MEAQRRPSWSSRDRENGLRSQTSIKKHVRRVQNVYSKGSAAAPFDQEFYLIMNVAAGGTSGWFPDGVGDKPWLDQSSTAIRDFTEKQATWSATWPSSEDDRAMRVKSVKMWKLC